MSGWAKELARQIMELLPSGEGYPEDEWDFVAQEKRLVWVKYNLLRIWSMNYTHANGSANPNNKKIFTSGGVEQTADQDFDRSDGYNYDTNTTHQWDHMVYERPVDLGVRRREVQREDEKPGIPGIRLATFVDQQEMPYVAMPDAPKTDLDYDAFNWESDSVNVDERISVADLGHTFLGGTVKLTRRNVVEPDSAPSLEETNKNFCANAACDQGEECVVPSLITIPDSNDLIINKNFHRDVSSDIDLILQTAIANENLLSSSTNDSKQNDYENYSLVDILKE